MATGYENHSNISFKANTAQHFILQFQNAKIIDSFNQTAQYHMECGSENKLQLQIQKCSIVVCLHSAGDHILGLVAW